MLAAAKSAGGVMGYGARDTSMGECLWLSNDVGETGISNTRSFGDETAPSEPFLLGPGGLGTDIEGTEAPPSDPSRTSFNFFLYFSLSFSARSRSLLRPKIMALCLSTSLQSWAFCWDCACFSFSRYWMTASALPAVLIRFVISLDPTAPSGDALLRLDLVEMADMAESIDEFLGWFLPGSARVLAGPAMVEDWLKEEAPVGCAGTRGSETLRRSFGKRRERGDGTGLLDKAELARACPPRPDQAAGILPRTHPGLLSSGVVVPEESLL
jgi:hypothetical protein